VTLQVQSVQELRAGLGASPVTVNGWNPALLWGGGAHAQITRQHLGQHLPPHHLPEFMASVHTQVSKSHSSTFFVCRVLIGSPKSKAKQKPSCHLPSPAWKQLRFCQGQRTALPPAHPQTWGESQSFLNGSDIVV
jgi:hypothetical protein